MSKQSVVVNTYVPSKTCPISQTSCKDRECALYDTIKKQCVIWNLVEEVARLTIAVENKKEA